MTAPDARCGPCRQGDHGRCTGSAGNIGCRCVHAVGIAALHAIDPGLPVIPLDPDRVRERLDELTREVLARRVIVDRLDEATGDERARLARLDRELASLREHPAVVAALAQDSEQAVGIRYRHPGGLWMWAESVAGGKVLAALFDSGGVCEFARDVKSGRTYVAPAGSPPPLADGYTVGRLVIPDPTP